jgi:hypothetical protein
MNRRTQGQTFTKEICVNMSDFEGVNLRGGPTKLKEWMECGIKWWNA